MTESQKRLAAGALIVQAINLAVSERGQWNEQEYGFEKTNLASDLLELANAMLLASPPKRDATKG
jgi:hypothetical protein